MEPREERDQKIKRNEIVVSFRISRGGTIPIASRRRVLDASRDGRGAFSINYFDRGGAAARPNSRVARTEESDARSSPPVQR